MPPAEVHVDPEILMRGVVSAVAVSARSRDVSVLAHVDNRLPDRLAPCVSGLRDFLRRGLARTIEAGHTRRIALALWAESVAPDGKISACLEVARTLDSATRSASRLADLWAIPLGGSVPSRETGRMDDGAESLLIPLAFTSAPGTPPAGVRWDGRFEGTRMLDVSDVLFDAGRLRASMASIGIDLEITRSADEALTMLRAGAAEGRPVVVMALDGYALGDAACELAREVRAEPDLARTKIILASAPVAMQEAADLFDATPWGAPPWRSLLAVARDLMGSATGRAAASEVLRAASPAEAAVPTLAGRRILVAEDVATNQMLLEAVLSHTGAAIEVVPDGARVVERHEAEPADLIVMDLQMPGMGGIAALRGIRALGGAMGAVPVIALTGYARSSDRKKALAAGMDAFLAKPIIVDEFYGLLKRLLPPDDG